MKRRMILLGLMACAVMMAGTAASAEEMTGAYEPYFEGGVPAEAQEVFDPAKRILGQNPRNEICTKIARAFLNAWAIFIYDWASFIIDLCNWNKYTVYIECEEVIYDSQVRERYS